MEKCKVCGGNCDNGELIGGVCPECREEERMRQIRADEMVRRMERCGEDAYGQFLSSTACRSIFKPDGGRTEEHDPYCRV